MPVEVNAEVLRNVTGECMHSDFLEMKVAVQGGTHALAQSNVVLMLGIFLNFTKVGEQRHIPFGASTIDDESPCA